MLIISIAGAAMICTIIFATAQSAYSQNATNGGHACVSCGPTAGTNLPNATNGGGNVTNDILSNPLLDKKVAK